VSAASRAREPAAVVLGGGPIAVPVARSLARNGVRVIALGFRTDPVRWSRYCAEFVDLGAGEGVQERWLAWLGQRREPGAVLLPCNDDALELIARRRGDLVDLSYLPLEADDDVVLAMLDKERTYELARSVGIPAPRTVPIGHEDKPTGSLGDLSFPIALKPRRSHLFARHFGLTQKVFVAADGRELADRTERLRAIGIELLACEIIPGPDDAYHSYYSFIDEGGEPLLHLTKRKLRQYPPGFGLATYHEVDRDPEVAELGLRFFKGVGLRGMGNVEFKRDARDGRLVLIECNPRFTAGHEIVRHAGIDLALLAYNRLTGRPLPPLDGYRAGVRMLHPVEDLRAALELRSRGRLGLRSWAASLLHRQRFPLFSWRDPQPSLHSWARFARRAVRR
jgi:D-aspartate ligase